MRQISSIAIFCGSNFGLGDDYREGAVALGTALAGSGVDVIYGGTHKGLMGLLANAALEAGGKVHGIITQRLFEKGHLHPDLSSHVIVPTMGVRKAQMLSRADACIALPGGIGTVEEFMEAWTLNQLENLDKPLGLYNVADYYQPFLEFIDRMVERRFLPQEHRDSISVSGDPYDLLGLLERAPALSVPKWL